jgi:anti-sigma-K factor RskA
MFVAMKVVNDTDLLIGEYVLGTLELDERQKLEEVAEREPSVAVAVMVWERRLAPLHELIVPVKPPANLWDAIAAGLDETEQVDRERDPGFFEVYRELVRSHRADSAMNLVARLRRWRSIAVVSIALSAVAIGYLTSRLIEPHIEEKPPVVAVLKSDALTPPFVVAVDPVAGTVTARSVPGNTAADRSYAFWLLRENKPPLPLGRLRGTGTLKPAVLAKLEHAELRKAALAVSIEPNDAPEAEPSGPFIYRGGFE